MAALSRMERKAWTTEVPSICTGILVQAWGVVLEAIEVLLSQKDLTVVSSQEVLTAKQQGPTRLI